MKFFRITSALAAMLVIGILGGCAAKDPGTPPDVLFDVVSVVVGQTTQMEL